MPRRSKKATGHPSSGSRSGVEAVHIPINQTGVMVKVIERVEREPEKGDLDAVATLLAHAINQPGLTGKVLGGTVQVLASLPPWLSPLNGLLGITIRNGLDILEALPRLPAPRLLRLKKPDVAREAPAVQRIQIK